MDWQRRSVVAALAPAALAALLVGCSRRDDPTARPLPSASPSTAGLELTGLSPGDRVAVKPQSSPAFHAVQYLLGRLPRPYMTQLRAYGGLQPYPSRTKDPDAVDFSTGSVGLGAVAPAFAAAVRRAPSVGSPLTRQPPSSS